MIDQSRCVLFKPTAESAKYRPISGWTYLWLGWGFLGAVALYLADRSIVGSVIWMFLGIGMAIYGELPFHMEPLLRDRDPGAIGRHFRAMMAVTAATYYGPAFGLFATAALLEFHADIWGGAILGWLAAVVLFTTVFALLPFPDDAPPRDGIAGRCLVAYWQLIRSLGAIVRLLSSPGAWRAIRRSAAEENRYLDPPPAAPNEGEILDQERFSPEHHLLRFSLLAAVSAGATEMTVARDQSGLQSEVLIGCESHLCWGGAPEHTAESYMSAIAILAGIDRQIDQPQEGTFRLHAGEQPIEVSVRTSRAEGAARTYTLGLTYTPDALEPAREAMDDLGEYHMVCTSGAPSTFRSQAVFFGIPLVLQFLVIVLVGLRK